jgi:hypothetical protein
MLQRRHYRVTHRVVLTLQPETRVLLANVSIAYKVSSPGCDQYC